MNTAANTALAAVALGAIIVAICAPVAARYWRTRADWFAVAYLDECAAHDATVRRAAEREQEAAATIDALCSALAGAVDGEPQPQRAPVRVGESVLERFNWN